MTAGLASRWERRDWATGLRRAAFRADVAPAVLCGMVASPESLVMSASEGYPVTSATPSGPHFWNKFAFENARSKGLIVSVLRANCSTAAPKVTFAGGGASIEVAGRTISVTEADVTVQ